MKKLITVLLTTALVIANNAYAETYAECVSAISVLNKSLPAYIDANTLLKNVNCLPYNPIRVVYTNQLLIDATKQDISDLRASQALQSCTTPNLRRILNKATVEFKYIDKNSNYINSNVFTLRDCR